MLVKPDWSHWQNIPEAEVWQCAALSLDFDPDKVTGPQVGWGWEDPEQMAEFANRLDILSRHIFSKSLPVTAVRQESTGNHESDHMVSLAVFVSWAQQLRWGMPPQIFGLGNSATQARHWPWGDHETKLLTHLDAAARKWWLNYDPSDHTTAPKSVEVIDWLRNERSVPQRVAEIIAQMLRPDDLPPGPRT